MFAGHTTTAFVKETSEYGVTPLVTLVTHTAILLIRSRLQTENRTKRTHHTQNTVRDAKGLDTRRYQNIPRNTIIYTKYIKT